MYVPLRNGLRRCLRCIWLQTTINLKQSNTSVKFEMSLDCLESKNKRFKTIGGTLHYLNVLPISAILCRDRDMLSVSKNLIPEVHSQRKCFIVLITNVAAVGCTNMIPPDNAWLKRSNNDIVIGCYLSQQTWQLKCDGHEWKGQVGTCPDTCEFRNE